MLESYASRVSSVGDDDGTPCNIKELLPGQWAWPPYHIRDPQILVLGASHKHSPGPCRLHLTPHISIGSSRPHEMYLLVHGTAREQHQTVAIITHSQHGRIFAESIDYSRELLQDISVWPFRFGLCCGPHHRPCGDAKASEAFIYHPRPTLSGLHEPVETVGCDAGRLT